MYANPFTLKEIPAQAAFCDRQKEIKDLLGFAAAGENALLYSPRRYGKTSLVRKVQSRLESDGAITAYCDLFGVSSVEDIAGRIADNRNKINRAGDLLLLSLCLRGLRFNDTATSNKDNDNLLETQHFRILIKVNAWDDNTARLSDRLITEIS